MAKYMDSGGLSHFMGLVKDNVDDAYAKILSRGEQLVVNGNGMLGDNTNFPLLTFDGSRSNGSPGSFTSSSRLYITVPQAEFMSVDTSKEYTAEFDVMSDGEGSAAKMYGCLYFYDADKYSINIQMVSFIGGSTTTLARELKSGDTVVYLEDASGFKSTTRADQRAFIFWDYTNSFGYTYPPETYSRNVYYKNTGHWDNSGIDYDANTVTLLSPYSGPTRPAGTPLSQGSSGGTYYYFWWNTNGTISVGEWMHASGIISGIGHISGNSANPPAGKFWAGAAYVKIGFLWNYNSTASDLQKQLWVTNISLSEKRSAVDVVPIAEKAREIISATPRVTNANTAAEATTALRHYLASSSMSSNKPMSDGHIIEMEWDNTNGHKTQLFVPNNITLNDPHIQWRPQNDNNWPAWITVFDTRSTIPIANGGTGATTAAAAWTALGGGAIGKKASLAASDIPSHASTATTWGTGTSSNYGHVKLSDATNSSTDTTGGTAATPKAVKAAYDLANGANTVAGNAMSVATGALYFKVTYSISGSNVVCAAHVYVGGQEVTADHDDSCFVWSMSLNGGTSWTSLGTGKTKTVSAMTAFGGSVKCDFTPPDPS